MHGLVHRRRLSNCSTRELLDCVMLFKRSRGGPVGGLVGVAQVLRRIPPPCARFHPWNPDKFSAQSYLN
jgi:hypothetical protein